MITIIDSPQKRGRSNPPKNGAVTGKNGVIDAAPVCIPSASDADTLRTEPLPEIRQLAQAMAVVSALAHRPYTDEKTPRDLYAGITARGVFDQVTRVAKRRGFKRRAVLVSAGRRASGTEYVLLAWEECLGKLTMAEIQELKRSGLPGGPLA